MRGRITTGILLLASLFTVSLPYYVQPAEAEFVIKNLSNNHSFSADPQIAVSGNNLYVVWEDFAPGNWDIFFKRSRDDGEKFSSTINLSDNDEESGRPQIAVSGSNVYVVWQDFTLANYDILFRASTDNGASFGNTVNLSNNDGRLPDPKRSDPPRIAASGSNVYVLWVDSGDLFLRISNDNGASFNDAVKLNNNVAFTRAFARPQIDVSGNNVYVVWVESENIFFRASEDNGDSFGEAVNLSLDSKNLTEPKRSDLPDIAISGSNVYVVWVDYAFGDYDIFFRASTDKGASFSNAVKLNTVIGLSDLPRIAVSGSNVYVVWEDYNLAEGLNIFFRVSTDKGVSFSGPVNLSKSTGYSISTPIAVSGSSVYIVSSVGNIDIFFRASTDNGASFGSAVNLSNNHGGSSDPSIAVSGNNVYVVWEDYAAGNAEIFFTKFIPNKSVESTKTMLLSTDNGSMNIEVTMDRGMLEPEQPVEFTLKFLAPITGESLQHVNYSFMITDEDENILVSKSNMHAHEGVDVQSVTFSNTGSFTLVIDVAGLGIDEPYDTRYAGMTSTALTVVPEFPLSILAVMAVIVGTSIAITRFRNPLQGQ